MRGKVSQLEFTIEAHRITPAHAGKSYLFQLAGMVVKGSPPRMRGKDSLESRNIDPVGITPAHAGKR